MKMFLTILMTGMSLFVFIFIFRKQAFDMGISKVGLNVTVLEIGVSLISIAMHEWHGNRRYSGGVFTAPVRWFGRNTYEIYLIHMFFIIFVTNSLFNPKQAWILTVVCYFIVIAMSGLFGQIVSSCFSEPLNRFIRRKNNLKKVINESIV